MKFTYRLETNARTCEIQATPGPYDGHPVVGSFVMERIPRSISNERMAIASILAFGPFINGQVSFPYPVAPATALAIQQYLRNSEISIDPIDFEPFAIEYGPNIFFSGIVTDTSDQDSRLICFRQRPIWDSFGSSFDANTLTIPTNWQLLATPTGDTELKWDQDLAAMVLFSTEFSVGTLQFHGNRRSGLKQLLESVGIISDIK